MSSAIFAVNIDDIVDDDLSSYMSQALAIVTDDEQARISSMHQARDRHRALVGRLLIRRCLSEMLGVSPGRLRLSRSAMGRPVLIEPSCSADFNLAHHGSWVVLIASITDQVGCDLVDIAGGKQGDPDGWLQMMGSSCLGSNEIQLVNSWPQPRHRLAQFMVLWALKESYLKAIGVGLHMDLLRLEFRRAEPIPTYDPARPQDVFPDEMLDEYVLICDQTLMDDWMFSFVKPDPDHLACFAVSSPRSAPQSFVPDLVRYSLQSLYRAAMQDGCSTR